MKTEPNWNEAPDGATLFWTNPVSYNPWFKVENGILYNFYNLDKKWCCMESIKHHFKPDSFIKRQAVNQQLTVPAVKEKFTTEEGECSKMETTTWNGKGTPPVGAVCEIYLGNYHSDRRKSGEVVKVLATAKNSSGNTIALVELCEKDGKCDALNVQCLRPFHDERDVFIEKASKAFYEAAEGEINDHAFGAIYDALKSGALKVPKVK